MNSDSFIKYTSTLKSNDFSSDWSSYPFTLVEIIINIVSLCIDVQNNSLDSMLN